MNKIINRIKESFFDQAEFVMWLCIIVITACVVIEPHISYSYYLPAVMAWATILIRSLRREIRKLKGDK